MFEGLTEKLNTVFKRVTGRGRLSEQNVQDALREVRLALLEADVNYKVVKRFIEDTRQRALGQEVLDSLTPGQQFIKIVREELTRLMGGEAEGLRLTGKSPYAVMLVGLQGSGKTTTAAKLAKHLLKEGHRPYLVPADVSRPAAIDQLKKLGAQISVPVYEPDVGGRPEEICLEAFSYCRREGANVLILDTAGRLHADSELMVELLRIKEKLDPVESLLVADAMTGQDAVTLAREFNEKVGITGVVLSKMEGDSRGGAALSIRAVTDKPIKFVGVGEKLSALEPFFPDRAASRILGMGDVLSLLDKAQQEVDEKETRELERKLRTSRFELEDFHAQLRQIRKLGSLEDILAMMPGAGQLKKLKQLSPDEKELVKIEAIMSSMTKEEKGNHKIINGSRRKRIARGSGTTVQDVNRLLKNFVQMKKMMERMNKKGIGKMASLMG